MQDRIEELRLERERRYRSNLLRAQHSVANALKAHSPAIARKYREMVRHRAELAGWKPKSKRRNRRKK